jgi:hypothetical protein
MSSVFGPSLYISLGWSHRWYSVSGKREENSKRGENVKKGHNRDVLADPVREG